MNGKNYAMGLKRMARAVAALVAILLLSPSAVAAIATFTDDLEAGQVEVWVVMPEAADAGSVVWVALPVWADPLELGSLHVQPVFTPEMQTPTKADLSLLQAKPVTLFGQRTNAPLSPETMMHLQLAFLPLLQATNGPQFVDYFPLVVTGDGIFEMDLRINAQTPDGQPLMIRDADNTSLSKEFRLFVLCMDGRTFVGHSLHDALDRYTVDRIRLENKTVAALQDKHDALFRMIYSADGGEENTLIFHEIYKIKSEIMKYDPGDYYFKYIREFARAKALVYNEFGYDPQRKRNTLAMEYAGVVKNFHDATIFGWKVMYFLWF